MLVWTYFKLHLSKTSQGLCVHSIVQGSQPAAQLAHLPTRQAAQPLDVTHSKSSPGCLDLQVSYIYVALSYSVLNSELQIWE